VIAHKRNHRGMPLRPGIYEIVLKLRFYPRRVQEPPVLQKSTFLLDWLAKRNASGARHYGLVGVGTILAAGLFGLCLPAQAQPAGAAEGTAVSTNYLAAC